MAGDGGPLKVVVEVDPSAVSEAVDKHAERLREEGRREVATQVYLALQKGVHGPAEMEDNIGAALMATAGPTLMQDIVAEQVVAEVREANELEGISETCPNCGSGDRLNNIIRTVGHPEEGQRCRHKFHREVDL